MDFKDLNQKNYAEKQKYKKHANKQSFENCLEQFGPNDLKEVDELNEELEKQRYMTEEELLESNQKISRIRLKVLESLRHQIDLSENGLKKDKHFIEYVNLMKIANVQDELQDYKKELEKRKDMNKQELTNSRQRYYHLEGVLMAKYRKFRQENHQKQKKQKQIQYD